MSARATTAARAGRRAAQATAHPQTADSAGRRAKSPRGPTHARELAPTATPAAGAASDALAEEATARTLSELGIGYTVWHDVNTGSPEQKLDHVVLGPTGLFAMLSEDYGAPVRIRKAELITPDAADERPMHDLGLRAKVIARSARVKFTALVIVLPDDELAENLVVLGSIRGATTAAVRQSRLSTLMRDGIPGARVVGGTELFDLRTRLQSAIRFV
jgi:hypothetical protein